MQGSNSLSLGPWYCETNRIRVAMRFSFTAQQSITDLPVWERTDCKHMGAEKQGQATIVSGRPLEMVKWLNMVL